MNSNIRRKNSNAVTVFIFGLSMMACSTILAGKDTPKTFGLVPTLMTTGRLILARPNTLFANPTPGQAVAARQREELSEANMRGAIQDIGRALEAANQIVANLNATVETRQDITARRHMLLDIYVFLRGLGGKNREINAEIEALLSDAAPVVTNVFWSITTALGFQTERSRSLHDRSAAIGHAKNLVRLLTTATDDDSKSKEEKGDDGDKAKKRRTDSDDEDASSTTSSPVSFVPLVTSTSSQSSPTAVASSSDSLFSALGDAKKRGRDELESSLSTAQNSLSAELQQTFGVYDEANNTFGGRYLGQLFDNYRVNLENVFSRNGYTITSTGSTSSATGTVLTITRTDNGAIIELKDIMNGSADISGAGDVFGDEEKESSESSKPSDDEGMPGDEGPVSGVGTLGEMIENLKNFKKWPTAHAKVYSMIAGSGINIEEYGVYWNDKHFTDGNGVQLTIDKLKQSKKK